MEVRVSGGTKATKTRGPELVHREQTELAFFQMITFVICRYRGQSVLSDVALARHADLIACHA